LAKVEPYWVNSVFGPETFSKNEEDWRSRCAENGGAPVGDATFRGRPKTQTQGHVRKATIWLQPEPAARWRWSMDSNWRQDSARSSFRLVVT